MKKILTITAVLLLILGGWYLTTQNFSEGKPEQSRTPTSADNAPAGSLHNLPVPAAVAVVRTTVSKETGVEEGLVIILSAYEKEWPNACLGLITEDELCAQVITPGFEVTAKAGSSEFTYRTNSDGSVIRRE